LPALFISVASISASRADDGARRGVFTERSIEGRWGFSGEYGVIVSSPSSRTVPQSVPTAAVGTAFFDGRGGCSVTSTINVNGTVFGPLTSETCTYSVNPDGTGTSVAEFSGAPFAGPASVAFVIVDREIRFLNTTSVVAGFTARRQ
jgi:hypothetical protein